MEGFEQLVLTLNEVFVYKVPPLRTASGHRAEVNYFLQEIWFYLSHLYVRLKRNGDLPHLFSLELYVYIRKTRN